MSPIKKPAPKRKTPTGAAGLSKTKQTARAALDSQALSKSAIECLIKDLEKFEKDVKDKDKALEDKEEEIELLQRRLDDQDQEIEGLEQDNEHNKDVIDMLESELMEFNKDNSKFVLECALQEEKERISRLKQAKSGLETDVARYKVQSKAAAKTAKEQEVKISQLERELAENKTLHAGSKNAKEKLDRLEKQWASMRRLMNEKPDDVVMKMELKSEEN